MKKNTSMVFKIFLYPYLSEGYEIRVDPICDFLVGRRLAEPFMNYGTSQSTQFKSSIS